ncbi:hypothetical protein [Sinomonas humi]|uniref:Lipoprotein n=1 Tax=Sinomonas humi TaxID=1338436 RepID=A0A0B2AS69_9MICC|nr:hypothetical protein [Sinomonas humi]KHL04711.1 hypothetical protein LK10_04240 [Sinomonas humi]
MPKLVRSSLIAGAVVAVSVALAACSGGGNGADNGGSSNTQALKSAQVPSPSPTPVSLDGKWKQTNSKSTDSWQAATISGNTIEIDWTTDKGDTSSLYWAGSVAPPATPGDTFTWTSNKDTSKTAHALLASSDATKVFTYDHGVISYSASILGTTTTVKLAPEK